MRSRNNPLSLINNQSHYVNFSNTYTVVLLVSHVHHIWWVSWNSPDRLKKTSKHSCENIWNNWTGYTSYITLKRMLLIFCPCMGHFNYYKPFQIWRAVTYSTLNLILYILNDIISLPPFFTSHQDYRILSYVQNWNKSYNKILT